MSTTTTARVYVSTYAKYNSGSIQGAWLDLEDEWAADWWESTGMLSEIPASLQNYIDYEAYARDARLGGDMTFVRHDGEVWAFNNC